MGSSFPIFLFSEAIFRSSVDRYGYWTEEEISIQPPRLGSNIHLKIFEPRMHQWIMSNNLIFGSINIIFRKK